ncbi:MAG: hypothetical protein HY825_07910 [Acidobacteria bacterium]|jgi:hypothetical protein|nr:hypothetical protein [Acidobacteriota bacterium]
MSDENSKGPDHTLLGTEIEPTGEAPEIYAVSDLRAFVKPDLDEELGAPMGGPATCGTEVLCTCVPVETCVCNTVSYHQGGGSCPGDCPCQCTSTCTCQCTSTCVSLYWHPY